MAEDRAGAASRSHGAEGGRGAYAALSGVCGHVCPGRPDALAGLCRRHVESGGECDRRRLLRRGPNLPAWAASERWQ